jgi:hypothetical protein
MQAARLPCLAAALALLAGCGDLLAGTRMCDMAIEPGLHVEVVDAVSGENLVPGAEGSWVANDFAGPLRDEDFSSRYLIGDAPAGRVDVILQHPGYAVWGRADVRIARGECGPELATVRAALVRSGNRASLDEALPGR